MALENEATSKLGGVDRLLGELPASSVRRDRADNHLARRPQRGYGTTRDGYRTDRGLPRIGGDPCTTQYRLVASRVSRQRMSPCAVRVVGSKCYPSPRSSSVAGRLELGLQLGVGHPVGDGRECPHLVPVGATAGTRNQNVECRVTVPVAGVVVSAGSVASSAPCRAFHVPWTGPISVIVSFQAPREAGPPMGPHALQTLDP